MSDLVEFLNARLDEDEAAARGTGMPPEWHQGPGDDDPDWVGDEMVLMWPPEFHTPYEQDKHWRGLTATPKGLAAHIARHDPARVLAEVEAKQEAMQLHSPGGHYQADNPRQYCQTCGSGEPHEYPTDWPCRTLRLLALPHADHPNYRDEWRP